jgi:cyclopropane-fatty-acyl-phospholipid synthase
MSDGGGERSGWGDSLWPALIDLAERGLLPDRLVREGIRRMVASRAAELRSAGAEEAREKAERFVSSLGASPVALCPDAANTQHYEVPVGLFRAALGPRLKYSCCRFGAPGTDLAVAEEAMLETTCRRAGLEDGMEVLDLGCGWGSFALFVAEHRPGCRVTAVSNSKLQREHIESEAARRGLRLRVRTADMNDFAPDARFDRVVSIEMFEHMRNWSLLLQRIASWLRPDGRLFVHHFCHREAVYPYEMAGPGDWMARHFFTGGMMPSEDLLLRFPRHLQVERRWRVGGVHYARTSRAWLEKLDAHRETARAALAPLHGPDTDRWLQRWRLFFMACEELFAFDGGGEWFVSHQLLAPAGGGP